MLWLIELCHSTWMVTSCGMSLINDSKKHQTKNLSTVLLNSFVGGRSRLWLAINQLDSPNASEFEGLRLEWTELVLFCISLLLFRVFDMLIIFSLNNLGSENKLKWGSFTCLRLPIWPHLNPRYFNLRIALSYWKQVQISVGIKHLSITKNCPDNTKPKLRYMLTNYVIWT